MLSSDGNQPRSDRAKAYGIYIPMRQGGTVSLPPIVAIDLIWANSGTVRDVAGSVVGGAGACTMLRVTVRHVLFIS